MKKIAIVLMCISFLIGKANIPFEKKGKWGIMDEHTGKTVVKAKFKSVSKITSMDDRFIVQEIVNRPFIGERLQYGVIDSNGKEIVPILADSIEITDNGFISFVTDAEQT